METFAALLALCAGNSPVTGEFPWQRPVTRSFDVFFDLHLNKRLSKQSWGWRFETQSCSLWRHCNVRVHFCHNCLRSTRSSWPPLDCCKWFVTVYYSDDCRLDDFGYYHTRPIVLRGLDNYDVTMILCVITIISAQEHDLGCTVKIYRHILPRFTRTSEQIVKVKLYHKTFVKFIKQEPFQIVYPRYE